MALTLLEAAKKSRDPLEAGVIELFPRSSDLLQMIPFRDINGTGYDYNREETLPGVGFRGINEAYTEATGVINPVHDPLVIAGGDIDVDRFIVSQQGADQRSVQSAMKVKALAHRWTETFIKGDNATEPREFDGLQNRLTGTQLIDAGTTANGEPLPLDKLDELIDAVDMPTHLLMNKTMRRRLTQATRSTTVGGQINYELDGFGRKMTYYQDLPVLIVDQDETGTQILGFTEAADSGTNTATSIYCVSFGAGMLQGIQGGGGMQVRDLGELDTQPVFRTRVEWFSGIALEHPRAAARLRYIADAAVTAT